MSRADKALSLFNDGFVCSQAIVAAYGPDFGLAPEAGLRIAAGLAGGMAGQGQACGAVTGAVLVLGLAKGGTHPSDKTSKQATSGAVMDLLAAFEKKHGSVNCNQLLGCDIGTADGYATAKKDRLFKTLCPAFVATAVELLEQILADG